MQPTRKFSNIFHPERYHGEFRRAPFFEGWYFKVVSSDMTKVYAFIPGISLTPDGVKDHAFIQVLDGMTGEVEVIDFPVDQFYWDPNDFDIFIGDNHFSENEITLDLPYRGGKLQGKISFGEILPWPKSFFSPGIMGPFGWLTFLECNHGVISLDHKLKGTLSVNCEMDNFDDGHGYIEKDWGRSFPSSWIWLQSNHFETSGTSLTVSVATVPLFGFSFMGLIAGLYVGGQLYSFATYNGGKVQVLARDQDHTEMIFTRGNIRLQLHAEREQGGKLKAPTTAGMERRITESLNAKIHVKLWNRNILIFDEVGQKGGMEIVG